MAARVTVGLAESNGSLPPAPGLWLTSPAGWLPRTGISSGTIRSVIEYGLAFYTWVSRDNSTDIVVAHTLLYVERYARAVVKVGLVCCRRWCFVIEVGNRLQWFDIYWLIRWIYAYRNIAIWQLLDNNWRWPLLAVSVYVTVLSPSVSQSVCPVDRQQQRRAAGLLQLGRGRQISIDSCRRRLPAGYWSISGVRAKVQSSGQRQCCDPRRINAVLYF